ncbi:MAG: hypothetical protein ACPHFX_04275, partial [Paracoccaceae bacterium]
TASEADELREKAEILRREAAELAELGRMEDAERVGREAGWSKWIFDKHLAVLRPLRPARRQTFLRQRWG